MQEDVLNATTTTSQKESSSSAQPENGTTSARQADPLPCVLARHKSDDCYFDVRLTHVELTYFHGKRLVHQLSFRLDLARPFEDSKRIRAAQLTINVASKNASSASGTTPEILAINPEASLIHIADHEVTTGQTVGVTAGAPPAAGGSLAANAELSWGDKTTFKGNRLVHGYIPSSTQAQWKMYEETRSQSGLPPVLYFLVILRAPGDFVVTANLHIRRWTGWGFFGMRKQVPAESSRNGYLVRKDLLDEPGQKAFQVSDDLLKLLDESDKKRQVMEDLLRMHFPKLADASEAAAKTDKTRSVSKKTQAMVRDAREELEAKFELWQSMAESDEQQDALTMLHAIADKILGNVYYDPITISRPRASSQGLRLARENMRHNVVDDEIRRYEETARMRMQESRPERQQYNDYDEPGNLPTVAEYRSRRNRTVFGKKPETAEEALANHRAVSKSWNESKL